MMIERRFPPTLPARARGQGRRPRARGRCSGRPATSAQYGGSARADAAARPTPDTATRTWRRRSTRAVPSGAADAVRPWRGRTGADGPLERLLASCASTSTIRVSGRHPRRAADRFVPARQHDARVAEHRAADRLGQTFSQPLIVARMFELLELRGDERVLDVGTGSGYHAALLAQLVAHVWTVEVLPELREQGGAALARHRCENVTPLVGDGSLGHAAAAPSTRSTSPRRMAAVPPALPEQLPRAADSWPGRRRRPAARAARAAAPAAGCAREAPSGCASCRWSADGVGAGRAGTRARALRAAGRRSARRRPSSRRNRGSAPSPTP